MNETTPSAANDEPLKRKPRIFRRGRYWWCAGPRAFTTGRTPEAAFKAWRRATAA